MRLPSDPLIITTSPALRSRINASFSSSELDAYLPRRPSGTASHKLRMRGPQAYKASARAASMAAASSAWSRGPASPSSSMSPEHGDALATILRLDPAQHRERRPHRGWIGVIAFIDEQDFAAGRLKPVAHPASLGRAEAAQGFGGSRKIGAGKFGSTQHGERIHDDMLPGHADRVGDLLAQNRRSCQRGTVLEHARFEPDVGRLGLAEAEDPADAGADCRLPQLQEVVPVTVDEPGAVGRHA